MAQGIIAWERYNSTTDIRAARVDVGSGVLGGEIAVADGADQPSVGIDISGNAMVVFNQSDGFRPRARARRLSANGTNDITVVLSAPSIYADFGTVAVADDGRAIASWMEGDRLNGLYTSGRIYANVFR